MKVADLKQYQDKTVVLHLSDGEMATAKVALVDEEYDDIIVDIIETDRTHRYKGPTNSAYTIEASDIVSIQEI